MKIYTFKTVKQLISQNLHILHFISYATKCIRKEIEYNFSETLLNVIIIYIFSRLPM